MRKQAALGAEDNPRRRVGPKENSKEKKEAGNSASGPSTAESPVY